MNAIDRTEEKLALAKELGLYGFTHMHEIMKMKFPPISESEIKRKLRSDRVIWKARWMEFTPDCFMGGVMGLVVGMFASMAIFIPLGKGPEILLTTMPLAFVLGTIFAWFWSGRRRIEVESRKLEHWQNNMPYGAFLAVKEAKEAGLDDFKIYFPVAQRERVVSDPIIVGYKVYDQFEVFAWDDGKIYE